MLVYEWNVSIYELGESLIFLNYVFSLVKTELEFQLM